MPRQISKKEKMANTVYKLSMVGNFAIIVFGVYGNLLDIILIFIHLIECVVILDGIIGSSDPSAIHAHLVAIQSDLDVVMEKLPETTNAQGQPNFKKSSLDIFYRIHKFS